MNAHVLLNLLNKLGEKDKMGGCAEHLIGFPQRDQDSIYHMMLKLHFISIFCTKTSQFHH